MNDNQPKRSRWLLAGVATAVATCLAITGQAKAGASPSVVRSQNGSSVPFIRAEGAIFNPTASHNFFSPNFPFGVSDFVLLPLAMQTPQSLSAYIPQVATSWRWSGHNFVVHLRTMRWQDGKSLTAADVVDSEILNGVASAGVWDDITGVRAQGAHTVVFETVPSVSHVSAESTILASTPLPASQYGKFVTAGLARTVAAYYKVELKDPTAAPNTPDGKTIAADDKKLLQFAPSTAIGDGPFIWKRWTTNELYLVKSPTFYNAKKVHVAVYEDVQAGPNLNGVLLNGQSDYTSSGMPTDVVEKNMTLPGHHVYMPPAYVQEGLNFNSRRYPLNITKVRQALVYVLHRPAILKLVYNHLKEYTFVKYPALLTTNESQYLSKKQLDSLNPYPYDPSKAASLLESVGFHKVNGTWHLPNGKPFTLNLEVESSGGYADDLLAFRIFTGWLDSFGIKAKEVGLDATTIENNILQGNFQIIYEGTGFYTVLDVDPLEFMASSIGTSNNFISKTEAGVGFGPVLDVPGIGRVDIPATITRQAAEVGPGKQMDRLVWDWAKFLDQQVPIMNYGNRNYTLQFSTLHYVDWPPQSSELWKLDAVNNVAGIAAMIEKGYIRPRS